MAGGWARDGAVQDQIDASVEDEVKRARSQLPDAKNSGSEVGKILKYCEECEDEIPSARRDAMLGVRLCVTCQSERDEEQETSAGFNRRGSKDSQLR